jgi:hypothetical protein
LCVSSKRIVKRFDDNGGTAVKKIEIEFNDGVSAVGELKRDSMIVLDQQKVILKLNSMIVSQQ